MNETDADLLAEADAALGATNSIVAASPIQEPAWWSTTNAMTMCSIILLFGLVVMGLSAWLLKAGKPAASVLRVFGTILVIMMATFLVVAGYDDKQIAAPLGLLGTIAGYLLGKDNDRPPDRKPAGRE